MSDTTTPRTGSAQAGLAAIGTGGLIAGALDISYATGFSALKGVAPMTILQSVASGLLGKAAYDGGVQTATLGFFLHFAMMLLIAAIFVGVRRAVPWVRRQNVLLLGPLFGVGVYFVMTRIVQPLSAFPMKSAYIPISFLSLAVHMFCIGLVIALAAQRFDTARTR